MLFLHCPAIDDCCLILGDGHIVEGGRQVSVVFVQPQSWARPVYQGLGVRAFSAFLAVPLRGCSCFLPAPSVFLDAPGGGQWKRVCSECRLPQCLWHIAILNLHASPYLTFKNQLKFQLISSYFLTLITAMHFYHALPKKKTILSLLGGVCHT